MMRRVLAIAAIVCAGLMSPAHAEMMISFDPNGPPVGGEPQQFFVGVGEQVVLPVYIFTPDGDPWLTDVGLVSSGVQIRYADTGTNASVNDVATDVIIGADWNDPFFNGKFLDSEGGDSVVEILAYRDIFSAPVTGTAILIGTLTFTGNVAGDVTDVRSGDVTINFPASEDVIVAGDNMATGLDDLVFGNGTMARITTVPEPSSLLLTLSGIGLVGLFVVKRRRR